MKEQGIFPESAVLVEVCYLDPVDQRVANNPLPPNGRYIFPRSAVCEEHQPIDRIMRGEKPWVVYNLPVENWPQEAFELRVNSSENGIT